MGVRRFISKTWAQEEVDLGNSQLAQGHIVYEKVFQNEYIWIAHMSDVNV